RFWIALRRWRPDGSRRPRAVEQQWLHFEGFDTPNHAPPALPDETARKVQLFRDRFRHWRRLARQASLSRCLETVLAETHYADWLLAQERGGQRHANVQKFLGLAQHFDQFQRQGLFRFLRFIEAQEEAEIEPDVAPNPEQDSVRLMSIHQSKG